MTKVLYRDFQEMTDQMDWSWLNHGRILISGATGMIPSYLAQFLIYLRKDVGIELELILLARSRDRLLSLYKGLERESWMDWVIASVEDEWEVSGKISHIIHAASPASPLQFMQNPLGAIHANVQGSERLLSLASKHPDSVYLYLSSSEVYGYMGSEDIFVGEEDMGIIDPLGSRASYPQAKRMGETLAMAWNKERAVDCRIARIFHTFGPGLNLRDGRVFSDFIASALKKEAIVMHSDGSAKRAFAYLSDTVMGLLYILKEGQCGNAYNVGNSGMVLSIAAFAKAVAAWGNVPLSFRDEGRPQSASSSVFPDTRKLTLLGWRPQVNLCQAIKRTCESFVLNES